MLDIITPKIKSFTVLKAFSFNVLKVQSNKKKHYLLKRVKFYMSY